MSAQSSIRIIGGKWRSRKVSFKTKDMLRPTPDRVRETLFNWLATHVVDATCLDLYAGSGVLGFEALSRGAAKVYAVESDRDNALQIIENKNILDAKALSVVNTSVLEWLAQPQIIADIVFVDPPYKLQLLVETLHLLEQNGWVKSNSLIYFEQEKPYALESLPQNWSIWRESRAGNVYYYLARKQ